MASITHHLIPSNSVIHFGILNSLRVWSYFDFPDGVLCHSNVGGFGIDGGLSTLIGSSLASKDSLHFGVFGDLAFFYDMNSLGNRHIGNNIRILLVNNGKGQEFRNCTHPASVIGEMADEYVAAAGHFGNKSRELVRNYVEALGFEYLYASSKEDYLAVLKDFVNPSMKAKSIVLEAFVDGEKDSMSLSIMTSLRKSPAKVLANTSKSLIRGVLGDDGIQSVRNLLKK